MRLLLSTLSALLLSSALVLAKTPDDFFHEGARQYIDGNREKAKEIVQSGLTQFPTDPKLKHLDALLKSEDNKDSDPSQEQKQNQEQKKSGEQPKEKPQDEKGQPKDQPDRKEQSEEQKSKDPGQQQPQEQKPQNAEQKNASENKDGKEDGEGAEAKRGAVARMTLQDALKLLDTTKDGENLLPFHLQLRTNRADRPFKNW